MKKTLFDDILILRDTLVRFAIWFFLFKYVRHSEPVKKNGDSHCSHRWAPSDSTDTSLKGFSSVHLSLTSTQDTTMY